MGTFTEDISTKGGKLGMFTGYAVGVVGGGFAGDKLIKNMETKAATLKKSTKLAFADEYLYEGFKTYKGRSTKLGNILGLALATGIALAGTYVGTKAGASIEEDINKKHEETITYA